MRSFKKWIALVASLSFAVFVLSACGNKASESNESNDNSLVIWSWGADEEKVAREDMVEIFAAANPDINIEHSVVPTADGVWDQRMTAALAAGTGPDVIQISPDWYGLFSDHFVDLRPFIESDNLDLESDMTEGMLDPYIRPDGKVEGMPLIQNTFALAYNQDMFDEFGVDYPTADWTWKDVLEASKQFASGEGANATYGLASHWIRANLSILVQGGSPYSDDLGTLEVDSSKVANGLNLFGELISSGGMPDNSAAKTLPQEQQFVSGRTAMYLLGGFETKLIAELIGDNFQWNAVPMPQVDNGTNNILFATGYGIVNTSKNQDLAWEFLKAASFENDEMAEVTARIGMPANGHVAENQYASMTNGPISNEVFLEGLSTARLFIWGGAFSEVGSIWDQVWESVTILGMDGQEAIDEYSSSLQEAFERSIED